LGAIPRAATLYSAGSAGDPDHEAVIRFSSRAPRRRRRCSSNQVRSPARIGTARSCRTVRRNSADCPLAPSRPEPAPKIESPPIAFVIDIETTGLRPHDRTVALAAIRLIGLKMPPDGHYYLVFDPRKDNHPEAEAIHGWDDWTLRFQGLFAAVAMVARRLSRGESVHAGEGQAE
jgi:DNA polymerase III epsilon subunit-like protein